MNGLDPNLMTPGERMDEIGLLLNRGLSRYRKRINSSESNELRDYSLDFRENGRIPAHGRTKGNVHA